MGNSQSNSQPTQQPQACADPDGVDCAGDIDASQQVDRDASQQVDGLMPDFENVVSGAQRSAEGSVHEGLSPMEDFFHRMHGPQHQHSCDSPLLSEQSRSESRASALPEPSSCFGSHVSSSGVAFPWDEYPFPHPCSSPPGVGPDPYVFRSPDVGFGGGSGNRCGQDVQSLHVGSFAGGPCGSESFAGGLCSGGLFAERAVR